MFLLDLVLVKAMVAVINISSVYLILTLFPERHIMLHTTRKGSLTRFQISNPVETSRKSALRNRSVSFQQRSQMSQQTRLSEKGTDGQGRDVRADAGLV